MALPQALVRESVAGTRLQITLKCLGLHPVGKGNVTNETPWSEFRRVGRFAGVVILEAAFEISGYADIAPARGAILSIRQTYCMTAALLRPQLQGKSCEARDARSRMADGVRFELTEPLRVLRFSRPVP